MSTTTFSLPFQTLFSRKSRQPSKKDQLRELVIHHGSGPPSHTQSLPGGRRKSSPPPDSRARNGSLSKRQPATVRGYKLGAGETHTFVSYNGHDRHGGHNVHDGYNTHSGGRRQSEGGGDKHLRRTTPSMNTLTRPGPHDQQRPSGHYGSSHPSHRPEPSPIIVVNGRADLSRANGNGHQLTHQRHISRPVAIPASSPQLTPTASSHATDATAHTSTSISASTSPPTPISKANSRPRRYSENQVITKCGRSLPTHYVPYRAPASCSGHGYGCGYDATTGPSSAISFPGPSDWPMEDSDEYDEDSEGPLDTLEVLESFYNDVPMPTWMAAVLVEDANIAAAHQARTASQSTTTPTPSTQSIFPRRSASAMSAPTTTNARSPPNTRSGFSLPFTTRPRIRRTSSVNNSSDNSSGSNKPAGTTASSFGYLLRSTTSNSNNESGVPIHQRPLPPVPAPSTLNASATGTGSLRQRLLRSRHASDVPEDPLSIPEDVETPIEMPIHLGGGVMTPSPSPLTNLDPPLAPFAHPLLDQHRPNSVVNHIIPPAERAEIGRRRYDSDSSIDSDDELSSGAPSINLNPPPQFASMPSSPFGSTHALPLQALSPPPRIGLNPPPRPRSRMNPSSNAGSGSNWLPSSNLNPRPGKSSLGPAPSPIPSSPSTSALGPSLGIAPWANQRTSLL